MVRIGIIGDIHHQFTHFDVDFFNNSAYDLLLCTGDLPYDGSIKDQHLVSLLASLTKPTLLIPGNHDCVNKAQFLAEAAGASWLAYRSHPQQQKLVEELRIGLSPVVMCGYSAHEFPYGRLGILRHCRTAVVVSEVRIFVIDDTWKPISTSTACRHRQSVCRT